MDRLIVFGDSASFITNILLEHLIIVLQRRKDIELCYVVDTARTQPPHRWRKTFRIILSSLVIKTFNPEKKLKLKEKIKYYALNLHHICQKHKIKVLVPPRRNINDATFVELIKEKLRPTGGLSLGCPQIMKPPLIDCFEIIVNYHNSLLPKYRGLGATAWSIYFNEKYSGFTFHWVNENIDDGHILIQGALPITPNTDSLEIAKTLAACEHLNALLDLIINRASGEPQAGEKSYFGRNAWENIITIENPGDLTYEELAHRLWAFGELKININGEHYKITKMKIIPKAPVKKPWVFTTQDNMWVQPLRFSYLPRTFYHVYHWIKPLFL